MAQGHRRLLYVASTGLNTVTDPVRINYDEETGISDLGVAVNVTIDQTGWISRREGYTPISTLDVHSMYSDGDMCVFVSDSVLYQLLQDYSTVVLKTGLLSNEKMAYAHVNGDFYYTNKLDLGIVRANGTHEEWVAQSYVGQTTNRVFDGPRAGSHLAFFSGRAMPV